MAKQSACVEHERLGVANQLVRFIAIGGACAVIDSGTYALLLFFGWPIWLAKSLAFVLGTTASYFVNRRFTFRGAGTGNAKAQAGGFALVYAVTFFVNVGANQAINIALSELSLTVQIRHAAGWIIAQGVSTMINFVMLKWVVFRENGP